MTPSQVINTTQVNNQNINLRKNYLFGEKIQQKRDGDIRIWLQNIRGFKHTSLHEDTEEKMTSLKNLEVDVAALTETNTAWTPTMLNKFRAIGTKIFRTYKAVGTSSDEISITNKQPGGAYLYIHGKLTGRVNKTGQDSTGLGRWCYLRMSGGKGQNIWLIVGYRVSQETSTGINTAYAQQERLLRQQGKENPKPKEQWDQDMLIFLQSIPKTDRVLLMIDANNALDDDKFGKFVAESGLSDVMTSKHGIATPSTYIRGPNTIDHILVSKELIDAINRSGITEFYKYIYTDHRGLYIDIAVQALFHGHMHGLQQRTRRKITTLNRERVKAYLKHATKHIITHNMKIMLKNIERDAEQTGQLDNDAIEQIDQEVDNAMKEAAIALPPYPKTWWTPEVARTHLLVRYWNTVLSLKKNKMEAAEVLEHIQTAIPSDLDIHQGEPNRSIRGQIRKALKNRLEARKDSFTKRQEWQETQVRIRTHDDDVVEKEKKITKEIKRIKSTEKKRQMYQTMGMFWKPTQKSGLTHVDVPNVEEFWMYITWFTAGMYRHYPWAWLLTCCFIRLADSFLKIYNLCHPFVPHRRITDKTQLDLHLYKFHVKHFGQAEGTPFTKEPLTTIFGEATDTPEADAFRKGKINIDQLDVDEITKEYLKELQPTIQDPDQIHTELTVDETIAGFKIWKEKTSTSPLGRHLGLYKAWIHKYKDDDILPSHDFFDIITTIINLCVKYGYALRRWLTIHNLYLQKEPGNFKIHRLRTLHKIDAELNLMRREIITKRLMKNARHFNYLSSTQHGGMKGEGAIDVPILTTFTMETLYFIRGNAAFTDCDARACYDCIVGVVTGLAEQQAGLPKDTSILFQRILKQLEYHMVTAYGLSDQTNTHTKHTPIHGIGQGATDAPPGWNLTINPGLKIYNRKAKGFKLKSPNSKRSLINNSDMFIDDKTLHHNGGRYDMEANELMQCVHHDINLWNNILWVTGGLLELLKSSYALMIWEFQTNGRPMLTKEANLPHNKVKIERNGIGMPLKRISETTSAKMLGVRKNLTLHETSELDNLKKKTRKFAQAITACPLGRHDIWICYKTIYIPSISYSLPATTITEKEFNTLHKIIMPKLLPRLGYSRSFPRAVAFGPQKYLAGGLYNLKALHLSMQIESIIKHIRHENEIGLAALIMLDWGQKAAGIATSILEDTTPLPYLEGAWVTSLRDGLYTINGKLIIPEIQPPQPPRERDAHLMQVFVDSKRFSPIQLCQLNYCCFYLKIEYVSDLTTSDGTKLHPRLTKTYDGAQLSHQRVTHTWPRQQKPNKQTWNLWNKALRQTICNNNGILRQKLMWWKRKHVQWKAYYNEGQQICYINDDNTWKEHTVTAVKRNYIEVSIHGTQIEFPRGLPITDLMKAPYGAYYRFTRPKGYIAQPSQPIRYTTFRGYLRTLPTWERKLLQHITEMEESYASLKTHIELGDEIWLVTDGGVKAQLGYYGWVIATLTHILFKGWGHAQGHPWLMASLRTESVGLLALLRFIFRYCEYHHIPYDFKKIHYCDNSSVVSRMEEFKKYKATTPTQCIRNDADIQLMIEHTLDVMNIDWTTLHVLGHQDTRGTNNKKRKKKAKQQSEKEDGERVDENDIGLEVNESIQKLSWQAQLNIEADKLATKAYKDLIHKQPQEEFDIIPEVKAYLYIEDKPITGKIKDEVNAAWTTQDLREHLVTKFGWRSTTPDMIDWNVSGQLMVKQTLAMKRFITRYTHERLPIHGVDYTQFPRKECPCCKIEDETVDHYLRCEHNDENWEGLGKELVEIYKKNKVDPVIRILINMAIEGGNIKMMKEKHTTIDWEPYDKLIQQQDCIGWKQILYGRFGLEWDIQQRKYLKKCENITSYYGESNWLRHCIEAIWNKAKSRWDYRCKQKHGEGNRHNIDKDLLLHRIAGFYSKQDELLVQDRHPFKIPLEEWKNRTVTQMQQWITNNAPFIQYGIKVARENIKNNNKDIRTYLNVTDTPNDNQSNTNAVATNVSTIPRHLIRRKRNRIFKHKDIRQYVRGKQAQYNNATTVTGGRQSRTKHHRNEIQNRKHRSNKENPKEQINKKSQITSYFSIQDRPPDDADQGGNPMQTTIEEHF